MFLHPLFHFLFFLRGDLLTTQAHAIDYFMIHFFHG